MTFAQLRSFATVARTGSVSAAAVALGVSEPAVSSAVAALRRDLGDALFVRAGGGIRLTPGGERLAAAAAEIIGLQDRLQREVAEARGERGLLRLRSRRRSPSTCRRRCSTRSRAAGLRSRSPSRSPRPRTSPRCWRTGSRT